MVLNKKIFLNSSSINKDDFIKICLSPDNKLIPDLCEKLPGKSVWLPADKAIIVDILRKEDLKTHFGVSKIYSRDLVSIIEMILRKKILECISLTKKAGLLAIGLDSIKLKLTQRKHCLVLTANGAKSLKNISFFSSENISIFENLFEQEDFVRSTGKNNVKYVGILSKNFKKTIQVDLNKLKGFIDNH